MLYCILLPSLISLKDLKSCPCFFKPMPGQGYLESTNENEPTRGARGTTNRPSVSDLLVEESTGPTKTDVNQQEVLGHTAFPPSHER